MGAIETLSPTSFWRGWEPLRHTPSRRSVARAGSSVGETEVIFLPLVLNRESET
jgi:hypothetical protein